MNPQPQSAFLILNAGSSSIKFGVYEAGTLTALVTGQVKELNTAQPHFVFTDHTGSDTMHQSERWGHVRSIPHLMTWLRQWLSERDLSLAAAAHRIVSARRHTAPVLISEVVLEDIEASGAADPEHSSVTLGLMQASMEQFASIPQVALFDSAFHSTLPEHAQMLPIPEIYREMGVRRYGFHGISYASVMAQVKELYGQRVHDSKMIIAHLGNGSSLAAMANGTSIDTTMSFSPTGGIPMSTRSGDLDPSVVLYMLSQQNGDTKKLTGILNNESGLKAISGSTGDMSALLKAETNDVRAKEAIKYFCYQVRKVIGSYVAALGGIEVLIFTGGVGEHLPEVRRRICEGLDYMGINLDSQRNAGNERELSPSGRQPMVLMLPSQEERIMAQLLSDFIKSDLNVIS